MNFTSEIFLFYFLPVTFLVYYALRSCSVKICLAWLSLASLVFYGWEIPYYVLIILFSVIVDWVVSNFMIKTENKKIRLTLLIVSLFSNLGLLAFFKYSGFIAENLSQLGALFGIELIGMQTTEFLQGIILPVGISFYTFQTLSYTIDIYDGKIDRARNFTEFLAYVSLFPQLVAGPIVRYSQIRDQIKRPTVTPGNIQEGLHFFILGLAKKVLIADSLAPLAGLI